MMNEIPHNPARTYLALALLIAITGISMTVLAGWLAGSYSLITFSLGSASMKVNTAIGFLFLVGGVLGIIYQRPKFTVGLGFASLILGTITVLEYLFGIGPSWDQWLAADPWSPTHPGRMSIGSAISFALAGAMLAVHSTYPYSRINRYDLLATAFLATPLFVFFSYIFDPQEVLETPTLGTMPLHACLNFLFFFFAISLVTSSKGAAGLLNRNTRNARNFRWLSFLVLILPLSLGSVLNYGVQHGWIGTGVGIAIFCLFSTLIVASALAHHTISLDHWFRQLTQEKRRSRQLKTQIHELLEISGDGILLFDDQLKILHANSGAERILGYDAKALRTLTLMHLLPEDHNQEHHAALLAYIQNGHSYEPTYSAHRITLQHQDGRPIPVAVTLSRKAHDDQTLIIAIIKNIEKLDGQIRSLKRKASIDPLTNTENRIEFEEFCRRINLPVLRKSDFSFCVMLLDIDNFKDINDTHGHMVGDRALAHFAQVVQNTLREGDRLFRTGGEEFIVVSANVPPEDALAFGERIRNAVQESPLTLDERSLPMTCSIGICVVDATTSTLLHAVHRADTAMYQAKHNGKNCCVLASTANPPEESVDIQ